MATHVSGPACGGAAEIPTCPSCGAELPASASTAPSVADHHQNLADRDQDAGDQDQTWSDHDQSASDDDQRSADEDQDAADDDLSAGGDAASHHHSKVARERSTHDRAVVSEARDESAHARTETAEHRDRTASLRDRAALLRDRTAEDREEPVPSHPTSEYFDEIREDILTRAKQDRARAAADRVKAADDRARAAIDREQAALARAEAYKSRSESEQNLEESTRDELTGALSRRFGLEQAARELERARRTGAKLTLAFVDVNGLKEVNDAQGHLAGDELLRLVGKTLLANLRSYDVVTRFGGDEFVCVMPHLTATQAVARFDRVTSILAAVHSEHSITSGLAEARPTDTLKELIARADAALLGAKAAS